MKTSMATIEKRIDELIEKAYKSLTFEDYLDLMRRIEEDTKRRRIQGMMSIVLDYQRDKEQWNKLL